MNGNCCRSAHTEAPGGDGEAQSVVRTSGRPWTYPVAMSGSVATRGAQHRLTLGFVDGELEKHYQRDAGRESLNGFRTIALASGVVWALATVLLPVRTNLDDGFAVAVGLAMSTTSFAVAALSGWARTLDRQHALATLLTTANGIVILTLALVAGILPGYGVAATTLLFAWAFVARRRIHLRRCAHAAVIAIGFIVAVELYTGPSRHGARRSSVRCRSGWHAPRAAHPGEQSEPGERTRPGTWSAITSKARRRATRNCADTRR